MAGVTRVAYRGAARPQHAGTLVSASGATAVPGYQCNNGQAATRRAGFRWTGHYAGDFRQDEIGARGLTLGDVAQPGRMQLQRCGRTGNAKRIGQRHAAVGGPQHENKGAHSCAPLYALGSARLATAQKAHSAHCCKQ